MRLIPRFRQVEERQTIQGWNEWLTWFTFQGQAYQAGPSFTLQQNQEQIEASFGGYVSGAYKTNGVIFACMAVRQLLFSEARFQFQQMRNGRPGDLFGTADLAVLEQPQPNQTTGDLLARAIQDADLAGNFYAVRRGDQIKRLRPDWVSLVLGSRTDPEKPGEQFDVELVGYLFHPGGPALGKTPVSLLPEEVAHFAPIPDPIASYRGMSWLTPVLREIAADSAATTHKLAFFQHGATPNLAIKLDPTVRKEAFDEWVRVFREQHEGAANAYKTLVLGGGADFSVVGADLQQATFKETQGAGETRIAAAAGVPPVIVGLSEGLAAATYSNYALAMRRFADLTMRPLWRNVSGAFANLVTVPGGSRLWYDARDIPALAENGRDQAEIQQVNAATVRQLVDAGFDPDSVIAAVTTGDFDRLSHSGLYSVQLQPAGTPQSKPSLVGVTVPTGNAPAPASAPAAASNGSAN